MTQQSGSERRMSQRNAISLDMRVYAYGMLVASGKTVDMSDHGLLLHIQQDQSDDELDPGKHLDILLEVAYETPAERWLPIKVVRRWQDGIAAHFIRVGTASG